MTFFWGRGVQNHKPTVTQTRMGNGSHDSTFSGCGGQQQRACTTTFGCFKIIRATGSQFWSQCRIKRMRRGVWNHKQSLQVPTLSIKRVCVRVYQHRLQIFFECSTRWTQMMSPDNEESSPPMEACRVPDQAQSGRHVVLANPVVPLSGRCGRRSQATGRVSRLVVFSGGTPVVHRVESQVTDTNPATTIQDADTDPVLHHG